MIRALMIDVDGVLVRGRPGDGLHWSTDLERDLGLAPGELQAAFFRPHWRDVVTGKAALRDRLTPVLARIAPSLPAEDLIAYWFTQDSWLDRELLSELAVLRARGLALHLATNQEQERMDHLWQALGLRAAFDGHHHSAALGHTKPDPAFYRLAAARTGLPADALLLVDDAPENVAGAIRAGWQALLWTGRQPLRELLAGRDLPSTKPA